MSRPVVGDVVTFDLDDQKAAQGQMKAVNILGGTGPLEMDPASKGGGFKGGGKGGFGGGGGCGKGGCQGSCQGTVKSFNDGKGWGFITFQGQDIFVHVKDCQGGGQPQIGDVVGFDLEENPQKPGSMKAKNVTGCSGFAQQMGGFAAGGKGGYGAMCGGGGDWGKG